MADNTLYLYTSLTAGSSHIVTATARLETILKANKLPFQAIDVATDDAARKLWGRRSRGRKLPGLVKSGMIVGDLEEIEEWNEYGELRMQVNNVQSLDSFPDPTATTSSATGTPTAEGGSGAQSTTAPKQSTIKIQSPPSKEETKDSSVSLAMRQASEEAASKAKENKANALNKSTAAAGSTAATTTSSTSAAPTTSGAGPTEKKESEKQKPEESESATTTKSTTDTTSTNTTDKKEDDSVRRKSIIGEIAGEVRRPKLVPEDAAVSSANLHADNPAALREHHRTSIVSATCKEERDQVAQDLRKSISSGNDEMLKSLRNGQGHATGAKGDNNQEEVRTIEAIPQDPFEE